MKIEEFIQTYTLDDVIDIEQYEDLQYRSLFSAWHEIHPIYGKEDKVVSTFLRMIIQTSIVSYQIGGSGEQRWQEFSAKLVSDFETLLHMGDNTQWREEFLVNTAYNKRIPTMKTERIRKLNEGRHQLNGSEHLYSLYHDMTGFNDLLGEIMNQKNYAKTITFGTKMFGYGCRIIFEELIYFPFEVAIPVDSRLTQIYQCMHNTQESYSTYILSYYNQLGKKYDLPPLHLDSLLRIKYRDTYFTKYRGAGTQVM